MKQCIACKTKLDFSQINEYFLCPTCGSYILNSNKPAVEDNLDYFNLIYKNIASFKISPLKKKIFKHFASIDSQLRDKEYNDFNRFQIFINSFFSEKSKVLEVGFGQGSKLHQLLQNGVDAYGLELSETATLNFQNKYPKYKDRVKIGVRFGERKFDVIYCCALFEHLDQPEQFLANAVESLTNEGILIIDGFLVINSKESDLTVEEDIGFWKPCHRIIYSQTGFIQLISGFNLELLGINTLDIFNYRVLSLHLKKGYQKISYLRNSVLKDRDLPRIPIYYSICQKALRLNSLALYGTAILKKK